MLHYIGLNYNNSQFTNAKVRQALSMAISRQGLCATQLQDYADPAVLPINPQPADTGVSYSLSADLMTAAQLLREAAQEGAASAAAAAAIPILRTEIRILRTIPMMIRHFFGALPRRTDTTTRTATLSIIRAAGQAIPITRWIF